MRPCFTQSCSVWILKFAGGKDSRHRERHIARAASCSASVTLSPSSFLKKAGSARASKVLSKSSGSTSDTNQGISCGDGQSALCDPPWLHLAIYLGTVCKRACQLEWHVNGSTRCSHSLEDDLVTERCGEKPVAEQDIAIELEPGIVKHNVDSSVLETFQASPSLVEMVR